MKDGRSCRNACLDGMTAAANPDALAGEALPLSARIVAIVGVRDALAHPHSYQFPQNFWRNDRPVWSILVQNHIGLHKQ